MNKQSVSAPLLLYPLEVENTESKAYVNRKNDVLGEKIKLITEY